MKYDLVQITGNVSNEVSCSSTAVSPVPKESYAAADSAFVRSLSLLPDGDPSVRPSRRPFTSRIPESYNPNISPRKIIHTACGREIQFTQLIGKSKTAEVPGFRGGRDVKIL